MIEIALLGSVSVTVDGAPLAGDAAQRRRVALLTLLVTPGFRAVTRDRLIGLLWPESDVEHARHLLSAAIHVLRKALGADAIIGSGDDLSLNPARVRADVNELRAAYAARDYERAITLYQGEFLAGFYVGSAPAFEQWVDGERAELVRLYGEALERAAAARDPAGAAAAWRQRAALDPYDARVALALMDALAAAGQRAAAIRHAHLHAQLLEQEFAAAPDERVMALAEELKLAAAAAPVAVPAAAPATAPVVADPAPATVTAAAPAPPSGPRLRVHEHIRALRLRTALVSVLATALLFAAVLAISSREREYAIAVHPFTGHPTAVGVAEAMVSELQRIHGVRMVHYEVSFRTRDLEPAEAIQLLGVDALLKGRIQERRDGQLALRVELVEASGLIRAQVGIVASDLVDAEHLVVDTIALRLDRDVDDESEEEREDERVSPEARDLYYLARRELMVRTPASLFEALRYYEQARAIAPSYAQAQVGVADALNLLGSYDYSGVRPDSAYPEAERAARLALELDPEMPEAHAALGNTQYNYRWDFEAAERSFKLAIRYGAEHTSARQWYSMMLAAQGRFREADRQARLAVEAAPRDPVALVSRAHVLYYQRLHAESRALLADALATDPTFNRAHVLSALNDLAVRDYPHALERLERLLAASGPEPEPVLLALHGWALARTGRLGEARAQLRRLEQAARDRTRWVAPELLATLLLALGENDLALAQLQRALDLHSGGMIYLRAEPLMEEVRSDPRYQALMRKVGI